MKRLLITLLLFPALVYCQTPAKQDSIVKIEMTLNELRAVFSAIDGNIDSKKAVKEILQFIEKKIQSVQPADKPKEVKNP